MYDPVLPQERAHWEDVHCIFEGQISCIALALCLLLYAFILMISDCSNTQII